MNMTVMISMEMVQQAAACPTTTGRKFQVAAQVDSREKREGKMSHLVDQRARMPLFRSAKMAKRTAVHSKTRALKSGSTRVSTLGTHSHSRPLIGVYSPIPRLG